MKNETSSPHLISCAIQEVSQNERKAMNLPDNESDSWFMVLSCRQSYRFLVNLKEVE